MERREEGGKLSIQLVMQGSSRDTHQIGPELHGLESGAVIEARLQGRAL